MSSCYFSEKYCFLIEDTHMHGKKNQEMAFPLWGFVKKSMFLEKQM